MNDSIPFCDKRVYIADHLIPEITNNLKRFPLICQEERVVQFTDIDPHEHYLASISLSKEKYLLFLTSFKGKYYSFFINQEKKQYFYCKFRFNESLYSGTLFTGEFFKNDKGSWSYYIQDIHYHSSKSQKNVLFSDRLELVYQTLKNMYTWDELMNICHLEIKPYFMYYYLEKVKHHIHIDKIYFIPESFMDPIKIINLDTEIKIDNIIEVDESIKTLIFTKTDQPDIYTLVDDDGSDFGIASIKTMAQSKYIRKYLMSNEKYRGKCKYNPVFKKWMLI